MQGKFNSFQRTMLQWDEMHPYNAVHIARVPGAVRAEQLQHSLNAGLEQCGLGRLHLDRRKSKYTYPEGSPHCEVTFLSPDQNSTRALQTELQSQINTPFPPTDIFTPFRFFVLPASDSFFLGLVYFHAAADAESIVLLLRSLVRAYTKLNAGSAPKWNRYPDNRAHLWGRHPRIAARKLMALPGHWRRLRQSHRPRYKNAGDSTNGIQLFSVGQDHWQGLLDASKDWNVTVNDLLLTLLLKCVSPLAAGRVRAKRRHNISVGNIVNLRREIGIDRAQVFGLFLGSFTITHEVSEKINLQQLAQDIRRQTTAIKQRKLALATPIELGIGRFVLQFYSPERRRKFYQKNYPLWGGLTNMNLNSLDDPSDENGFLDYMRAVSTGPVTPLVFSVTTIGNHANVGVSYRTTVFSAEDITNIQTHFMQQLERLRVSA